ncbi:hypothetical protein BKA69DRAFT_18524 [Paraphysoderma sedebokerense]|nr:hypothetical protein BKA69DRAFT_18524 [Paraphysoderma sedebokerense]
MDSNRMDATLSRRGDVGEDNTPQNMLSNFEFSTTLPLEFDNPTQISDRRTSHMNNRAEEDYTAPPTRPEVAATSPLSDRQELGGLPAYEDEEKLPAYTPYAIDGAAEKQQYRCFFGLADVRKGFLGYAVVAILTNLAWIGFNAYMLTIDADAMASKFEEANRELVKEAWNDMKPSIVVEVTRYGFWVLFLIYGFSMAYKSSYRGVRTFSILQYISVTLECLVVTMALPHLFDTFNVDTIITTAKLLLAMLHAYACWIVYLLDKRLWYYSVSNEGGAVELGVWRRPDAN